MRSTRIIVLLIIAFLHCTGSRRCEALDWRPQRQTNQRYADLYAKLIDQNELDLAEALCEHAISKVRPPSDAHALWTRRLCELNVERLRKSETISDDEIPRAKSPVESLLRSYPDHPRQLFLRSDSIDVLSKIAEHDLLIVSVNRNNNRRRETAMRRLARVSIELETLIQDSNNELANLNGVNPRTRNESLIIDLKRLLQELHVSQVKTKLYLTDVFEERDERIAAASVAMQVADDALATLPTSSDARLEVERLRIMATIRSEDLQQAAGDWKSLRNQTTPESLGRVIALGVQISIAQERHEDARKLLDDYSSESQGPSLEIDLARLQWMLESSERKEVGDWIKEIGKRHGDYAMRRGEAIVVASLSTNAKYNKQDSELMAMRGRELIREDSVQRGADLIAAAAYSENNSNQAIQFAIEAAAGYVSIEHFSDAADVLRTTSLKHKAEQQSPALHLHSIVLLTETKTVSTSHIETLLHQSLDYWPDTDTTRQAGQWLINVQSKSKRFADAASTAIRVLGHLDHDTAIELWLAAFWNSESLDYSNQKEKLDQAILDSRFPTQARTVYTEVAGYCFDENELSSLPEISDSVSPFAQALLRFRMDGTIDNEFGQPPITKMPFAIARLMRDGRQIPEKRAAIAQTVTQWSLSNEPSFLQAERLLWLGNSGDAIKMVDEILESNGESIENLSMAANLLGGSSDHQAIVRAIQLWNRLANGLRLGSMKWHDAKTESMELMVKIKETEKAKKIANYILLTRPPEDSSQKERYQEFVKGNR